MNLYDKSHINGVFIGGAVGVEYQRICILG